MIPEAAEPEVVALAVTNLRSNTGQRPVEYGGALSFLIKLIVIPAALVIGVIAIMAGGTSGTMK
jgi:hypothetical protein